MYTYTLNMFELLHTILFITFIGGSIYVCSYTFCCRRTLGAPKVHKFHPAPNVQGVNPLGYIRIE